MTSNYAKLPCRLFQEIKADVDWIALSKISLLNFVIVTKLFQVVTVQSGIFFIIFCSQS